MSTAGKVLTVLILLVMIGWTVVLASITQLNMNWHEQIAKQEKTLTETTDRVESANKSVIDLTEAIRIEQTNRARDLRDVEDRIIAAERRQSTNKEHLTAVQSQLAAYLAAVEKAQANNATREAEKVKVTDDLAKKRDEIAKTQAVNSDLRDQLGKLQDEFKQILADNARKANDAGQGRPAPRPASSGPRPSPAS